MWNISLFSNRFVSCRFFNSYINYKHWARIKTSVFLAEKLLLHLNSCSPPKTMELSKDLIHPARLLASCRNGTVTFAWYLKLYCECTWMCVRVCVYIYIYIYIYIGCEYTHMHTHVHVCVCVCLCIYVSQTKNRSKVTLYVSLKKLCRYVPLCPSSLWKPKKQRLCLIYVHLVYNAFYRVNEYLNLIEPEKT